MPVQISPTDISVDVSNPPVVLEVRDQDHPGNAPLAWVLVERTETYHLRSAGESVRVSAATLTLRYQRLYRGFSRVTAFPQDFVAKYDGREVDLIDGSVFMDLDELKGRGIGSYLFNELVKWGRQWPSAHLRAFYLSPLQATSSNKLRRNRFYERVGIRFDYDDPEQASGNSVPMRIGDLTPCEVSAEKIRVLSYRDYIEQRLEADATRRGVEEAAESWARRYRTASAELGRAHAHPIQWAASVIRPRLVQPLILLGMLAAFALVMRVSA